MTNGLSNTGCLGNIQVKRVSASIPLPTARTRNHLYDEKRNLGKDHWATQSGIFALDSLWHNTLITEQKR